VPPESQTHRKRKVLIRVVTDCFSHPIRPWPSGWRGSSRECSS
jgi:hypothetical protein